MYEYCSADMDRICDSSIFAYLNSLYSLDTPGPPYGLFPWSKCDINLFGLKWGLPILKACRNFKFLIILKWTLNIKANAQTRVTKKLYFLMEVSSILLCIMKKFNLQHSNSWVSLLNKIKKDKINNRLK